MYIFPGSRRWSISSGTIVDILLALFSSAVIDPPPGPIMFGALTMLYVVEFTSLNEVGEPLPLRGKSYATGVLFLNFRRRHRRKISSMISTTETTPTTVNTPATAPLLSKKEFLREGSCKVSGAEVASNVLD